VQRLGVVLAHRAKPYQPSPKPLSDWPTHIGLFEDSSPFIRVAADTLAALPNSSMGRAAAAVVLTTAERSELESLANRRRTAQGLAQRARIVFAAADGLENKAIAQRLRPRKGKKRRRNRRHAAGEDGGTVGLIPDRQPILKDFEVGVVEARIDQARFLARARLTAAGGKVEEILALLGILENEGRCEEDRRLSEPSERPGA
jgi:hypothetical protein